MAKVQKVSTRAFKEQAVQLAQTSGKPLTQVAREGAFFPEQEPISPWSAFPGVRLD